MPLFILGLALTVGVVLLLRGFLTADPHMLAGVLRWTGIVVGVVVALLLIDAGREGVLIPFVMMGAAAALRGGRWRRWVGLGEAGQPAPGRTSRVDTRFLRMVLDHDSGALTGDVLAGRFQGRALGTLGFDELMELLAECRRDDAQSATVLETWLDRAQGPDWRGRAEPPPAAPAAAGPMSRDEALSVLGLQPGAPPEAVKEAHRRLMTKLHPDHGGSTWLAAKLNQARDLLLDS